MQATLDRLRARREQHADEGGFTLIELLIVIVILGILAGIVVFAVQNLTSSSAKASAVLISRPSRPPWRRTRLKLVPILVGPSRAASS